MFKLPKIDVRGLNHASPFFRFQVISKGRLIYARDERTRVQFETLVRMIYFDLAPFYKQYFDAMDHRLKGGEYGIRPKIT